MKVLATYNIKGGVGKTATAVNLAYLAAASGARTLVWDLDPQGAASFYFRVKPKVKGGGEAIVRGAGPSTGPSRAPTTTTSTWCRPTSRTATWTSTSTAPSGAPSGSTSLLRPLAKEYDYVFLDCPPSISLVSENVFRAADALLVPLIPTTLSLRTLSQLDAFLDEYPARKRQKVLAFFSMVDQRKNLHRELVEKVRADRPEILAAQIPAASDIERMGVHRAPLPAYAPRGRSAAAYRDAVGRDPGPALSAARGSGHVRVDGGDAPRPASAVNHQLVLARRPDRTGRARRLRAGDRAAARAGRGRGADAHDLPRHGRDGAHLAQPR